MRNRNPLHINPNARGPRYTYERPRARLISSLLRLGLLLAAVVCLAIVAVPYLVSQGVRVPGVPLPPPTVTTTPSPTLSATPEPTTTPAPTRTEGPTPTNTSRPEFQYTVVEGDSLYSIAIANEVTIQQLAAANGKTSDSLAIGEVLIIPPPDYQIPTATPFPPDLPAGTLLEHTIRPGETLAEIAAAYLTTVDEILAANDEVLFDANIAPAGTVIVVRYGVITPTPPAAPATETPTS
jgi:LysM repeat protein